MKKYLGIGFLLCLFLFPSAGFAQERELVVEDVSQDDLGNVTDEFQEKFFEALKQKAIENHEKAIDALLVCLALDPQPVVYFELGKNYNALKRFSDASIYLEKAREAEPENEAVLAELFTTYYLDHQFGKAIPVVEELRQLNSSFSEDLANLYVINEQFDEALEILDALDEEWGESPYREGLRRQIYSKTGNADARIKDLQEKIAENPQEEQNYLNLIFVYSETGDPELAFETAKQLLAENPTSELVHLALYKFYLNEGKNEEAVNSMKVVLNGDQIEEETKYQVLNDFLIFVGENPSLEIELMEVVEIFSDEEGNTEIFSQLGTFFLERDQREKALEFFEAGMDHGELSYNVLIKTLLLQMEFGRHENVKDLSEEALGEYPAQPLLYLINGTALNKLGSFEEAEEILTFGLDFLIDDPAMEADFYRQLSLTYTGLKEASKASEFEKRAAKLKPANVNE